MKMLLLAGTLTAALASGLASGAAEAKTNVRIYLGLPHYSYQVGPDYRFRPGWGWYRPGYPAYRNRLSCNEARQSLRSRGYRNIQRVECDGRTYTFRALRNGNTVVVYVNSRTGAVWRG